jgi:protein-disulfide isomerase
MEILKIPIQKNIFAIVPVAIVIGTVLLGFLLSHLNFYRSVDLTQDDLESMKDVLSKDIYDIDTSNAPAKGTNELGVEIVIFEDFQCSACRMISKEVEKLMDYYQNKISIIIKHYPLEPECFPINIRPMHPLACEASYASLAAREQGKFWDFYDLAYSGPIENTAIKELYKQRNQLIDDLYQTLTKEKETMDNSETSENEETMDNGETNEITKEDLLEKEDRENLLQELEGELSEKDYEEAYNLHEQIIEFEGDKLEEKISEKAEEIFIDYAERLKLNIEQFKYDYNSERIRNIVKKDAAEGHYSYRITGTPTFFFNGRKYSGRKNFKTLRKITEFFIEYDVERWLETGEKPQDQEETEDEKPIDVEEKEFEPENYLSEKIYDIDTENSPVRGENKIGVELIVFEDFECPACRQTAQEIEKVMEHFDYEITLVFKHYPLESECFPMDISDLHEHACEASYASLAAMEQDKFWEYYDLLYSDRITGTDILMEYARQIGLDMESFQDYYESEEAKNRVLEDTKEGFEEFKIKSTPSLFFNGKLYRGPKDAESLIKIVDYLSDDTDTDNADSEGSE